MANEFKVKNGLVVSGSAEIEQDLRVRGTLTVDEFHTSITTSSIIYESGSTRFGNSEDDTHTFTGSMNITGSISLNGQAIGTGKLDETTFNTYTSSYKVATTDFNNLTGSYNSFSTSYVSVSSSFNSRIGGLESFSSSLDASFVNESEFGNFSSSIKTFTSSLNSYTTSLDNKLNTIDSTTGSLNSYTSSTNGRLTSIESATASLYSFSSSVNNRLATVETSTGSLNSFTSSINSTIKDRLNFDGVISGSSQILNASNIVSSSVQVTNYGFAITGSNLFKGTQTLSGSIIPSVDNTYDLGSADYQWRDVYISSGSLYIDGTKVISSTSQELQITTDNGQSIKILEGGTDSIILQTADGDIELKSNADGDILLDPTNGKIMLKGAVEILNGNKIQSSVGGTPVVFANDIVVSGSIDITGTIEGINLTDFSSSVNTRLGNLESSGGNLNSFTASAISRLNTIESTTSSLNSYTTSNNTRLGIIESTTSSLNSYTSSNNTRVSTIESTTASLNSFTSSANTKFSGIETVTGSFASYSGTTNGRLSAIETSTSSLNTHSSSTNNRLTSIESTTASLSSANTTQDGRITSLENKTGSYATTGSNIFQGNQTITGSLFVSENLIIAGSSSIQHISSSVVNIGDNIITVNTQNPSIRFGGLAVIDSGSSPTVSGSMLFDSTNNQWIFVHQNQGTVTSSVLLMGPETYNDLGGELYITQNRLVKSTGIEHLAASNISDNGTTVTMLSNTVVNGTFSATGTTLVSGSSQINHNTTTNYDANQHVDHTTVSITAGSGLSGGGTIASTRTVTLDTGSVHFLDGVKKELNTEGVVSGSSQITYSGLSGIPSGIVSGSSQILAGTTIHSGAFFNGISVVSGSAQISFGGITGVPSGLVSGSSQVSYTGLSSIPSGIVSGSSQVSYPSLSGIPSGIVSGSGQIDLTATTNYSTGIKTRLNAEGVLSGSAQVVAALPAGTVSGSSQVLAGTTIHSGSFFNGISVVSGSGQISFGGITGVPSGLVSGSSQITFGSISSIPSGLVSGSSQITYGSISSIPSGIVSGSAQLTSTFVQKAGDTMTGALTAPGITSSAGLTVSGTAYYTFNKPSTTNYQTVALFGSTANGIFITTDSGIISRGAFFNGGWQATSTTGAYLNFNTSGGGMDLNVFSGATIGGAATFTSLFTVARDNFSFNNNAIWHAGNFTPGNYLPLAGGTMTGAINMVGTQQIRQAGFAGIEYYNSGAQWQGYIGTENNTGNLRYNSFSGAHTWYANSTQTMALSSAGRLSLSGSNSGSDPLVNLTATGTGTFQRGVRLLNSGMNAGDHIMMAVGQADSARNMGQFYFQYNGAGSTSNRISMGLHSVDDVFNIWGNGNVEIGSTFNSGYKLDVAGQIRAYAGSSLIVSMSTVASNDAVIAARWTSGTGLEMRYNPNNALCYIDSTYPLTSGQVFGDIHIRQNVGGTMTSRMIFKAETGHVGIGTSPTQRLHVNGFVRLNGVSVFETGGSVSGFIGHEKSWTGSGSSNTLAIASEGGNEIKFYTNGSATVKTMITLNGTLLHGHTAVPTEAAWLGTAAFGRDGYNKVMCGSLNSTTTGAYVVGHNSALNDWADLNFGALNLIFRYQQTERARFDTSGHFIPGANSTYNLGSASLRWNTIFTSDLSLSNGIGDYTIVEGEEKLYLYNNKNNKVYSFVLQEEDPATATPKKI